MGLNLFKYTAVFTLTAALLSGCSSTPAPIKNASIKNVPINNGTKASAPSGALYTPIPQASGYAHNGQSLALPDRAAFQQKDNRWGGDELGHSGDTMASDGCLVTASAMALKNLGFDTDPGDLNTRLTQSDSFTPRGWLIWSGISKVTGGKAKARFYNEVNAGLIDGCLRDGYYPMARFVLPNGRTHWAVILKRDARGYHMRDPLQPSKNALLFPRGADAFKSVRCIGMSET